MLLNVPHPFSLPEMSPTLLLTSVQRSVCVCLSHFNNLRCHCCPAVVLCHGEFYFPCRRKAEWLCLLSLISQFFWRTFQSCSEIFVGHPTFRRPESFLSLIYSCPLSPKNLASWRQLEVSLLLNWAELLSSEIKFVCFPLLSIHVWPLT